MNTLQVCLHPTTPDPAIIITGGSPKFISHASLASNVKDLQLELARRGVTRGTRVSIVHSNPYVFTVAFLAFTLQGSFVAPLNPNLKTPELESYFQGFGPELVVLSEDDIDQKGCPYAAAKNTSQRIATGIVDNDIVAIQFPDSVTFDKSKPQIVAVEALDKEMIPDPASGDVALVLHTSGTTGKPKPVPLTHGNIAHSISTIIRHYNLTPSDRAPVIMPLFHIHGLVAGLFSPLASGGSVIYAPEGGLTPSFHQDALQYGATWYTATPTLHKRAIKMLPSTTATELPKYRFVRSCSSRLEGPLLQELARLYECPIVEAYAMTEAAHQVCSNPVDSTRTREGSVGEPTGVQVSILDDNREEVKTGETGEICIKGPNLMAGYLDNPQVNTTSLTADGFFRTGDLGRISEDGYVSLTGRIKEQINKGGQKVSPVEVDEVINQHPDVAEAVTFTIPDELYGENVGVAVVLKNGASLNESDLKEYVGERLLLIKVPREVFFTDEIPKTAVGKLQRGLVASAMLARGK